MLLRGDIQVRNIIDELVNGMRSDGTVEKAIAEVALRGVWVP